MLIMIITIAAILIGASQLLFVFINSEDEAIAVRNEYEFKLAKIKSEEIDLFTLGDKFPSSKSTYRVDIRKGVI